MSMLGWFINPRPTPVRAMSNEDVDDLLALRHGSACKMGVTLNRGVYGRFHLEYTKCDCGALQRFKTERAV